MRALLLSDIHGNLEALTAALAVAAGRFDTVWNLGDTVGYGGSPNQVIDLVRPLSSLTVRGNHARTESHPLLVGYCSITRTARAISHHSPFSQKPDFSLGVRE